MDDDAAMAAISALNGQEMGAAVIFGSTRPRIAPSAAAVATAGRLNAHGGPRAHQVEKETPLPDGGGVSHFYHML